MSFCSGGVNASAYIFAISSMTSEKRGCKSARILFATSFKSFPSPGFCCRYKSRACSTTPAISGWNIVVAPVTVRTCFAVAIDAASAANAAGLAIITLKQNAPAPIARVSFFISAPFVKSGSAPLDAPDPVGPADHGRAGQSDKQSVLHHPRYSDQSPRNLARVLDAAQRGIDDEVSAVRDESMAVLALAQRQHARLRAEHRLNREPRRTRADWCDFDRQRKPAEHVDTFAFVANHDHPRRRGRDDLLPQQRSAAAFYQREIRRDLVGAVDGEIERRRFVERGQRNAARNGLLVRGFRRRHRDNVEHAAPAFAEQIDEMFRRRTSAEAEPHPGAHEFDRAGGGGVVLVIRIHHSLESTHPAREGLCSLPW